MSDPTTIGIGLTAAVVAVQGDAPEILVARAGDGPAALPAGTFEPRRDRTLEIALRSSVAAQTALDVGYVEQLYTFGDRGRAARREDVGPHMVSIGYLALTRRPRDGAALAAAGAAFRPWYGFFPWEDWRRRRPEVLDAAILPALGRWTSEAPEAETGRALPRLARARLCFGFDGAPWDEEKVLDRYELLYEAGLVEEALRDGRPAALARDALPRLGEPMRDDHRRILATAMGRLRAKLKYRPVVFELMPPRFTLTALQQTVEAVAGRKLHKQNFRRLVESTALVEPTGAAETATGGRPAQLYRFRSEVIEERPAPGLRFGRG
ncbi:NUDIX hydrolase [Hansschlegelia plantiphila]|uniref:NAD regulator n=1 Tax=Hansschlegelia plantiphila TaxID=374655 RepID=A0A9W6J2J1_9HYPH|nr:NAD regulator [Hansschlegelia plantiphila]GLK68129.1 NAD regulator [Hansschlegelia plantiphila]